MSLRRILFLAFFSLFVRTVSAEDKVALIDMNAMILPGTAEFLSKSIERAAGEGAKIIIVELNTPGGILTTSQEMVQTIFAAPIPVAVYVSPRGSTATSAGVFITMAAHIAAMAPGTSIGAAHPVAGNGADIEGDMRKKAENATAAMVKSISAQRGRNSEWAEKSVRESSSLTYAEALKDKVIDLVAEDVGDLLHKLKGRKVKLPGGEVTLEDYSGLPRVKYEMDRKQRALNVLANPNVAALLWLGATTGLSLELYNPGLVLPGVVGVICLILALAVSQIIPLNTGGVLLLLCGMFMIASELVFPSFVMGIGGVIAVVLGALYLVDTTQAPGMSVDLIYIGPIAFALAVAMLSIAYAVIRTARRPAVTGEEGIVGQTGHAMETIAREGRVFVNGEFWNATSSEGLIEKDSAIEVVGIREGLLLEVKKLG